MMQAAMQAYSSNLSKEAVAEILADFNEVFQELLANGLVSKLIATFGLILVVAILRWIGARIVRRLEHLTSQTRRKWLVYIRNAALALLLVGLIGVWADALRVLAYSLFAIAVATVIAFKELIQCVTGSFLRSSSHSFRLGDRIEIGTMRGDVIDQTALYTTLLEVGSDNVSQQPTGRAITIPNSLLLDKPIINESFTHEFVLHQFKIPVKLDEHWKESEANLLCAAEEECRSYLEEARKHFSTLSKKEGLSPFQVDPRVTVRVPKPEELELLVRVAVPARKKSRVEQAILRRYLEKELARKAKAKKAPDDSRGENDTPEY